MRFLLLGMCACLSVQAARGQANDTLLAANVRNARIGFNSLVWQNSIYHGQNSGRHQVHFLGGQNFLYNQEAGTGGGGRFVQQDYFLNVRHRWQAGKLIHLGQEATANVFAANGNHMAEYMALAGLQCGGSGNLLLAEVLAGAATDKRGSRVNNGPALGARVWLRMPLPDSSATAWAHAQIRQVFINPRYNSLLLSEIGWTKAFGSEAMLDLRAGYLHRRVEDYSQNLIQSIASDTIQLQADFATELFGPFSLKSQNRVLIPNRDFRYRTFQDSSALRQNTGYQQVEINSRQELQARTGRLFQSFAVEIGQRTRNYRVENNLDLAPLALSQVENSEKTKDIEEYTIGWFYTGKLRINARSVLEASTVARLFRVTTPSLLNDQDRDDALYSATLALQQQWWSFLRTTLRVSGSNKHQVFLASTQSAQNFMEQIIRLEPVVVLSFRKLTWTGTFGIWANYNVRDYSLEQDKNRANRVLLINQQLVWRVNRRHTVSIDLNRRENRIAAFNKENFTESPIDTVVITEWYPRMGRLFLLGKKDTLGNRPASLRLEVGYKAYRQVRHYEGGVSEEGLPNRRAAIKNLTFQHGPAVSGILVSGNSISITADFWLQRVENRGAYRISADPFLGPTLPAADLTRLQIRYYPFFSIAGTLLIGR